MVALQRRAMAVPIVLGLVFCMFLWLVVLFYSHSESRHSLQLAQQKVQAYYLALAGFQHLFLKLKEQPYFVEKLRAIEDPAQRDKLLKDFADDIALEVKNLPRYNGEYRVQALKLKALGRDHASISDLALEVSIAARVGRIREVQNKLIRIRRR